MAGHYGGNPLKWDGGTNAPHVSRYFLARGWALPGETVLDAACCTGYGSKMISEIVGANGKVIGIDVDEGCIETANREKPKNCEFICADLDKIELPDVDVAITIESCEHVCDFPRFLEQLQKHVRRCIVVTVPIGGTTYAYVNEPPSPATEKTDFNNLSHVESLFATNGWKCQTAFTYGYSAFCVFYKAEPQSVAGLTYF